MIHAYGRFISARILGSSTSVPGVLGSLSIRIIDELCPLLRMSKVLPRAFLTSNPIYNYFKYIN